MIDWVLQPHVFYPGTILIFAVWFARVPKVNWLVLVGAGVLVTFSTIGLWLLLGLQSTDIPNVLTFKYGGALYGLRQFMALGYTFLLAGLLRCLYLRVSSPRRAPKIVTPAR